MVVLLHMATAVYNHLLTFNFFSKISELAQLSVESWSSISYSKQAYLYYTCTYI